MPTLQSCVLLYYETLVSFPYVVSHRFIFSKHDLQGRPCWGSVNLKLFTTSDQKKKLVANILTNLSEDTNMLNNLVANYNYELEKN